MPMPIHRAWTRSIDAPAAVGAAVGSLGQEATAADRTLVAAAAVAAAAPLLATHHRALLAGAALLATPRPATLQTARQGTPEGAEAGRAAAVSAAQWCAAARPARPALAPYSAVAAA